MVKGASIWCKHVTGCYQLFIIFFSFLFQLPSAWFLTWTAQHEKMAKSSPSSCLVMKLLRTNTVMHTEHARKTNLCQLVANRPSNLKPSILSPLVPSGCPPQTCSSLLSRQFLFLPFTNFTAYPP